MASKAQIRKGDTVIVIAGGNKKTRPNKGKVGRILEFENDRVVVEGVNLITVRKRAKGPDRPGGTISKEGSIHVSNVMFYAEKIKRPVRIKHQVLADGTKVRGYIDPQTKKFEQIAEPKVK